MSSTLRSDARNQHIADYYVTPVEKILEFLAEFSKEVALNPKWKVLDPTAGGDELHPMSYPAALKTVGFNDIATIDNMFNTSIGIPNANTQKRERLITDEVNKRDMETQSLVELWLETMQDDIKKVNEMFNLDISVSYRFKNASEEVLSDE